MCTYDHDARISIDALYEEFLEFQLTYEQFIEKPKEIEEVKANELPIVIGGGGNVVPVIT